MKAKDEDDQKDQDDRKRALCRELPAREMAVLCLEFATDQDEQNLSPSHVRLDVKTNGRFRGLSVELQRAPKERRRRDPLPHLGFILPELL